ncbi:MAG: helix-turn-helix domain-containing protein [Pseudonocardiaceae bacterium]|nr:helix-turn-helix domain-containing protein [Pseudonocardiaceae bacterium]
MAELWNVGVLAGDGVAPFELGVACEVFGTDRSEQGLPVHDFAVCGIEAGPVRTKSGFHIHAPHGLDRLAEADLVLVPPMDEPAPPSVPAAVITALRAAVGRGAWVAGLCTGVFALGYAGLLDGRRAAVHWNAAAAFESAFPKVELDPFVLYVAEPPVFTSAGTAAAIDLCLHLVRESYGSQVANAIARRMVVPPHRDGGQAQYIELPVPTAADALTPVLAWLQQHLDRELNVPELARRAHMSPRTFARRFAAETGTTPHHWLTTQRVIHAQWLLETTHHDIETIARSCGFGNASTLRHHFNQRLGTTPTSYRRTFASAAS